LGVSDGWESRVPDEGAEACERVAGVVDYEFVFVILEEGEDVRRVTGVVV